LSSLALAAVLAAIRSGQTLPSIDVRPLPDERFLIVHGHHRAEASRALGLPLVPAKLAA
jgi:ParB-like chromosome segregation protein Spo0J